MSQAEFHHTRQPLRISCRVYASENRETTSFACRTVFDPCRSKSAMYQVQQYGGLQLNSYTSWVLETFRFCEVGFTRPIHFVSICWSWWIVNQNTLGRGDLSEQDTVQLQHHRPLPFVYRRIECHGTSDRSARQAYTSQNNRRVIAETLNLSA